MSNKSNIQNGPAPMQAGTELKMQWDCPRYLLPDKARRGLYGDEWDNNLRGVALHVLMTYDKPAHSLADFTAVVHPERLHDFLAAQCEGKNFSVMRTECVWHDMAITRDGREIQNHAHVGASLCSMMSVWDEDNQKHAHAIRNQYGTYIWADRRWVELFVDGRAVYNLHVPARSTKKPESSAT